MDIEDLVHAGWLAYQEAIGRPTVRYPISYAVWGMFREILIWYGGPAAWESIDKYRWIAATPESEEQDYKSTLQFLTEALTPRQRELVRLHVLENVPLHLVASHMRIDQRTAWSTKRKALNRLRAYLTGQPLRRTEERPTTLCACGHFSKPIGPNNLCRKCYDHERQPKRAAAAAARKGS